MKIEPERLKLSVLPDNVRENKEPHASEADLAVKVYLSTTLPAGKTGIRG